MKKISLATERYWIEPGNFELWPDILSCLPDKMDAQTVNDMAQKYMYKEVHDAKGNPGGARELYGLMGLITRSTGSVEIKGVNLIRSEDKFLFKTAEALELSEVYKNRGRWEILLARQLLRYSPRCRAVVYLFCKGGALQVPGEGELNRNLGKTEIKVNGVVYRPFSPKQDEWGMNRLLKDFREEAMGPYWKEVFMEQGSDIGNEWEFSGVVDAEPACYTLGTLMRPPMALFIYLDWLKEYEPGKYYLDQDRILEDLDGEEIFPSESKKQENEIELLKRLIEEYGDFRGYFPVEVVLEKLQKENYPNWQQGRDRFIDYFITNGIHEGFFQIENNESGQPRHGRGYLGRREYQLLKLRFLR